MNICNCHVYLINDIEPYSKRSFTSNKIINVLLNTELRMTCRYKTFWMRINVQPSCCLDVVVYMLNCVFWRHILLEIEFKSRVDMAQIASGILYSGIAHERQPNFRHRKKTQKKNRNGGILRLRLAYGRRSNKMKYFCRQS